MQKEKPYSALRLRSTGATSAVSIACRLQMSAYATAAAIAICLEATAKHKMVEQCVTTSCDEPGPNRG